MRNLKVKTFLPDSIEINGNRYIKNTTLSSKYMLGEVSNIGLQMLERLNKINIAVLPVLSKNLRQRTDLYGKPYQPTKHIFTFEPLPTPPTEQEVKDSQVL